MDIHQYLTSKKVRTFSIAGATTDIKLLLKESGDVCVASTKLFNDLLGIPKVFDDELYARLCVKKLIVELYHSKYQLEVDAKYLLQVVTNYAQKFMDDPQWSFLQSNEKDIIDEDGNVVLKPVVEIKQQVVEDLDVKVAVKTDASGNVKIKKGGKKLLAIELYKKHVTEAVEPMKHADFVKLIKEQLDLTDNGANTYGWNLKAGKWTEE